MTNEFNYNSGQFTIDDFRRIVKEYLDANKIPYKEDDICNDYKRLNELPRSEDNDSDSRVS